MHCTDYQMMTSRLLDGEMTHDESAPLFAHLAACAECRTFHHRILTLNGSLDRIAAAAPEYHPAQVPVSSADLRQRPWWSRQVSMRLPAFAILLCILGATLIFGAVQHNRIPEPETVYLTRLPDILVTAD